MRQQQGDECAESNRMVAAQDEAFVPMQTARGAHRSLLVGSERGARDSSVHL